MSHNHDDIFLLSDDQVKRICEYMIISVERGGMSARLRTPRRARLRQRGLLGAEDEAKRDFQDRMSAQDRCFRPGTTL